VEPTVTDAYVVLGRIAPRASEGGFLGGTFELDVDAAVRVYEGLGRTLGVDAERAAAAVIDAANASMRRALGVMTMQRGRDPRATPLVAFGGGGGLAAAELARALGMPSALVPKAPGVLSAYGMTRAERTADRSHTLLRPLRGVAPEERARQLRELCEEAREALEDAGKGVRFETSLALRYRGQSYELALPDSEDAEAAFHAAHQTRFGWNLVDQEVQLVHLRVRATCVTVEGTGGAVARSSREGAAKPVSDRHVVFDADRLAVPVFERALLELGDVIEGPAIIDEYSGTTVIPPLAEARVVGDDALLITTRE
jgi:N-methylhydantoinase A